MLTRNRDCVENHGRGVAAFQGLGAVATAFPLATEAGLELLRAGGNAIDAAVGAAWALCVCEPSASGLGGQTVLLIHFADGHTRVIDGHSRAPLAASLDTVSASQQRRGYRSCTIPSTPATLDWVHRKYGALSRGRVMAPAIRIAEEGYGITLLQHRQIAWVADALRQSSSAALFLRNGLPPDVGCTFRQPQLSLTLRRMADLGIEEFYHGAIARQIAVDMESNGGLLTEADLRNCGVPAETEPVSTVYRGHRVITVPPPGGGLQLLLALNILAQLAPWGFKSTDADWHEAIALAASAVFRERELRPHAPDSLTQALRREHLSEAYARRIATDISGPQRSPALLHAAAEEAGDTTHLSVCDRYGNIIMLTQSIQSLFGAKVAHRDLGFLYNNYLCTCPRYPHPYALGPGCRPRSNAAPTLVLQADSGTDRRALALGAAGSRRIVSALLQVISGIVDRGLAIAEAVSAPRVHGLVGRKVWIERPAASEVLLARLRSRGREPIIKSRLNFAMGSVQALQFLPDASVRAAADPRRDGSEGVLH
jgi:gamma-glutamyltranspeptidase / glutathione hydrolase